MTKFNEILKEMSDDELRCAHESLLKECRHRQNQKFMVEVDILPTNEFGGF